MVLIVVDTLRRDHLGCYGYPRETSPRIDELAADSVRFAHAVSQAPWTTPSIGALLTSRYPTQLGIRDERSVLAEELVLLPEVLRRRGYATAAVVSHSFCSSDWGFDQGFESFDETFILGHDGIVAEGVTDEALTFLERRGEEPFFLFLHYFDPHNDYLHHPEFAFEASSWARGAQWLAQSLARQVPPLEPFLRPFWRAFRSCAVIAELRAHYDSEIAFTDHHIGRFLDRLRELGQYEDTLVVLTADHGEEFGDHGRIGHAHSLYQELIGVPLIVKYPHGEPDVVEHPVALVDVYPTVLEAVGATALSPLAGRSLLSREAFAPERVVFAETSRKTRLRAAIRGRHKLILDLATGDAQLFDLAADPREKEPREIEPEGDAGDAGELLAALDAWLRRTSASAQPTRSISLSPETVEHLRRLGYVGE